jgi:hypothetical protein
LASVFNALALIAPDTQSLLAPATIFVFAGALAVGFVKNARILRTPVRIFPAFLFFAFHARTREMEEERSFQADPSSYQGEPMLINGLEQPHVVREDGQHIDM